jgi:hypothetical protein
MLKQEGEGRYMSGLSTGAAATIALAIGLAVGGCDLSNRDQPSTTTGGVTSRGGIGSTGIDGSVTRGGTGDTDDMGDSVGTGSGTGGTGGTTGSGGSAR